MSAFMVSEEHINKILRTWRGCASFRYRHNEDLQEVCNVLAEANAKSVDYRYNENNPPAEYKYKPLSLPVKIVEALKLCDSLRYQSCEPDDFEESRAAELIRMIIRDLYTSLPGYEEAEWAA